MLTASVEPLTLVSVLSLTLIRLPLPLLKVSVASSFTLCAEGTVFAGALFTAVTLWLSTTFAVL